jgi:hypothetical protein
MAGPYTDYTLADLQRALAGQPGPLSGQPPAGLLAGNGYDYGALSGMPRQAMPNVPLPYGSDPWASGDLGQVNAVGPRPEEVAGQIFGGQPPPPLQPGTPQWLRTANDALMAGAQYNMPGLGMIRETGLPMDYASRMARAKEMGFDTPVYHGTGTDISEFSNAKSVRQAYGAGTHVAENPNLANVFASQFSQGGRVMPLMVRLGKVADADTFKQYANQNDWDMMKTTNALKADGYDSVKYAHGQYYNISQGKLVAAKEGEDTAYAILNPENIRSKAAAFDPKQRNSRNIMAGLAGLAAGTGGLMASDRSQQ